MLIYEVHIVETCQKGVIVDLKLFLKGHILLCRLFDREISLNKKYIVQHCPIALSALFIRM